MPQIGEGPMAYGRDIAGAVPICPCVHCEMSRLCYMASVGWDIAALMADEEVLPLTELRLWTESGDRYFIGLHPFRAELQRRTGLIVCWLCDRRHPPTCRD